MVNTEKRWDTFALSPEWVYCRLSFKEIFDSTIVLKGKLVFRYPERTRKSTSHVAYNFEMRSLPNLWPQDELHASNNLFRRQKVSDKLFSADKLVDLSGLSVWIPTSLEDIVPMIQHARKNGWADHERTYFQEPWHIIDFNSTCQFELTNFCARANMLIHRACVLEFEGFYLVSLDVETRIYTTVNTDETIKHEID